MTDFRSLKQYQVEGLRFRMLWLGDGDFGHSRFAHYGYGRYVQVGQIVEFDYYLPEYGKILIKKTEEHTSFVLYVWDEGIIWEIVR